MNILIAGGGKVGSELSEKLTAEGHEITLIDSDAGVLEDIMVEQDVMSVQGNAASMETLDEAGVRKADLLIAATDADEVNLLACMTAHALNPKIHTIGRIRSPEYRQQAYRMQKLFGVNMVINPEREAAIEISRLLKYPGFLNIDTFAKGSVEIVSMKIDGSSKLKDVGLKDLSSIVRCQVLVCAVLRDGTCLMPDGSFVLRENDVIFVTASEENLTTLLKNLNITRKVKNVLIAGGGKISVYLAQELIEIGIGVSIIEQDEARCNELAGLLPKVTIIHGDASSQSFLDSEGIERFDALVTLTGLDELNIVMSLYGSVRNVPQIITKLSRAENNRILDSLSIGSVVSPKELITNSIVKYVLAMQNSKGAAESIHRIANGRGEAIEFIVDESDPHCGEYFRNLKIKNNVLIVSITKGERTEIATGNSVYNKGDVVVVVANDTQTIRTLSDIYED